VKNPSCGKSRLAVAMTAVRIAVLTDPDVWQAGK
jgi:hypothetical protein